MGRTTVVLEGAAVADPSRRSTDLAELAGLDLVEAGMKAQRPGQGVVWQACEVSFHSKKVRQSRIASSSFS